MAIVTGDRYLDLLSSFIEANKGPLLDGGLVLKLNPVGLHYLQARLDALQELEGLRLGAPVDYLRAYVADLGDHRALEQLRSVLRLLGSVKVVSVLPPPVRDPTPLTLLPFSRLRSVELRGCDLSTSPARGLLELRPILETLICYNSADALRHIFAERTAEIHGAQVWSRLSNVSCFGNGMLLMDDSLQLLPAVEVLDLSRNRFAKVANLQKCSKLKFLDAGFNHITTVESLNQVSTQYMRLTEIGGPLLHGSGTHFVAWQILHGVTKLILRNNALVSTRGLQRMAFLEALDLSYNLISNFREVELLGQLPSLRFLWLEGNPLSFSRVYRREVLSYFSDPSQLTLDGRQTNRGEVWAAGRIVARRLKQRSKYGAFTPAETDESCTLPLQLTSSGELPVASGSSLHKARKKISRLASIQDLDGLKIASRAAKLAREGSFSSLVSFDSEDPSVQVSAEAKELVEETVQDLMQQTEVLKRAGSSTWLKDLNALLEKEVKMKSKSGDNDAAQHNPWQKFKKKRSIRKGRLVSRDSAGSNRSGEDHGSEERPARSSPEALRRNKTRAQYGSAEIYPSGSSSSAAGLLHDAQKDGEQPQNLPPYPSNGGVNLHDSTEFRLTEELVTGKMSASAASSPPQFDQALLHRRQTLERELLQLPPEREISPFYDSDSSSETTIYSQLSDSSDSLLHSPSAARHPFTLNHDSEDPEMSSEISDGENTLQGKTDVPEPSESGFVGGDEALQVSATERKAEGAKNSGEVGESSGSIRIESSHEVPSIIEENLREDEKTSHPVNNLLSPSRVKPSRRVIDLDSSVPSTAACGTSGSRRTVEQSQKENSLFRDSQQRTVSSYTSSGEQDLHRTSSFPIPVLVAADIRRSQSTDANLGKQPNWSGHASQEGSVTASSSKKGESHQAPDSSLQLQRVHHVLGPYIGQCA